MATWVALLRGVNVGGKHRLPMADLRAALAELGFEDVATYVQSGNVVFRSPKRSAAKLGEEVADTVESLRGFRVPVLVLSAQALERAAAACPYAAAPDPTRVQLAFLWSKPKRPDLEGLRALATKTEAFELDGDVLHLHAPDGIGRSKLAAQVERKLGVEATVRNLRTVTKLLGLAASSGGG